MRNWSAQAELLCAALFVSALLLYMRAADNQVEGWPLQMAGSRSVAQRLLVVAALTLMLLAAFAKEIGITAVGLRASTSSDWNCLRCTHLMPDVDSQSRQVDVCAVAFR